MRIWNMSATHCLIWLSRGGADASVVREFDLTTKGFVTTGFKLPEGKHVMVNWVDNDTLLVASPLGENAATTSGYPLVFRR